MNRIPLVLLTGFLGSGKTTILNSLLAKDDFRDTAVVINEAGDVGLDHLLVEQGTDTIVMLEGGCMCCRAKGSLSSALAALLKRARDEGLPPFKRVVVETSGLSDPAAILEGLIADVFFNRNFAFAGIVTTVDARAFATSFADHVEASEFAIRHQPACGTVYRAAGEGDRGDVLAGSSRSAARFREANRGGRSFGIAGDRDRVAGISRHGVQRRAGGLARPHHRSSGSDAAAHEGDAGYRERAGANGAARGARPFAPAV